LRRVAKKHSHGVKKRTRNVRSAEKIGTRIANRFKGCGFEKGEIKELRGQWIFPAQFDEK
jgi:hypothetical protein